MISISRALCLSLLVIATSWIPVCAYADEPSKQKIAAAVDEMVKHLPAFKPGTFFNQQLDLRATLVIDFPQLLEVPFVSIATYSKEQEVDVLSVEENKSLPLVLKVVDCGSRSKVTLGDVSAEVTDATPSTYIWTCTSQGVSSEPVSTIDADGATADADQAEPDHSDKRVEWVRSVAEVAAEFGRQECGSSLLLGSMAYLPLEYLSDELKAIFHETVPGIPLDADCSVTHTGSAIDGSFTIGLPKTKVDQFVLPFIMNYSLELVQQMTGEDLSQVAEGLPDLDTVNASISGTISLWGRWNDETGLAYDGDCVAEVVIDFEVEGLPFGQITLTLVGVIDSWQVASHQPATEG